MRISDWSSDVGSSDLIVAIDLTVIVAVRIPAQRQRRLAIRRRLLRRRRNTVRLINRRTATIAVETHRTVALIVVIRALWSIHRQMLVVGADPVQMRVVIRTDSPLQHAVRRKTTAGYDRSEEHTSELQSLISL